MRQSKIPSILCVSLFLLSILTNIPVTQALNYGMDSTLNNSKASFHGENGTDGAGMSVDLAGDVNGDGLADMVIGAPYNDDVGSNSGKAYLVLGSGGLTMDTNLSTAAGSFRGETAGDEAGTVVAGVGDVNGDGYDDFIITAYKNDDGGVTYRGKVYLIFGKASGWARNVSLANADASFLGEGQYDSAGFSADGAGDVNGDGYSDIIIGAPSSIFSSGNRNGQVYIIFGKASGWSKNKDLSGADASFVGKNAQDYAGTAVAGAGDLNGDHYDDIIIGAYGNDDGKQDGGTTYVIFGKPSGWSNDVSLTNVNINASYYAEADFDYAGWSLNGAGDVNADGYDDFLVGAKWHDNVFFEAGTTYLVLGKKNGWATGVSLATVAGSWKGEAMLNWAGFYQNGAGDVNGDGYDDFLIDAPWNGQTGSHAGQAYLILGKNGGWAQNTALTPVDASWLGAAANYQLGISLAGGGDVDGDGYGDIILGEPGNPGGGTGSGAGFLICPDANTKPTSITSVTAYSDAAYSKMTTFAKMNDTIYIQIVGSGGGNATRKDTAVVNVSSSASAKVGFRLKLMETGIATNTYRGTFDVKNRTRAEYGWIGAKGGETVTVKSVQDGTKSTSLLVVEKIISPALDITMATEDQMYDVHYTGLGWVDESWTFTSNATWLSWNASSHGIEGVPDNGDVGQFWVRLNVSYTTGGISDEHYFTVTVLNNLPVITTADVLIADEEKEYRVDYNCTDDGQGNVTWSFKGTAKEFLSMDPKTGVLNGTPSDPQGASIKYYVNITVNDGNGGKDRADFEIIVRNVNDPPRIGNVTNFTVREDEVFQTSLHIEDYYKIDVGDSYTWGMETNATWLWSIVAPPSYMIHGNPENADVGSYWVNVRVRDQLGASDSVNFTITVLNVNDPPIITSQPVTNATIYSKYVYQVVAEDIDKGDNLLYQVAPSPFGMVIDHATGLIIWTPSPGDKGTSEVVVRVYDQMEDFAEQSFIIEVTEPSTWPPLTRLLEPVDGATVKLTNPLLRWDWDDKDSTNITFDVFLGTNATKVTELDQSARIASGVVNESMAVTGPLTVGTRYYWTVIGKDGTNSGLCRNGVWSFNVSTTAYANHGPAFTSTPPADAFVGYLYNYKATASDEDGDALTFQMVTGPAGLKIDPSTGALTWKPTASQLGPQSVKLLVSDGILTAEQSFVIQASKMNNAPTVTAIADQAGKVGKSFTYQVQASDPDGDKVNYSLKERPDGMTVSDTGLISWKPAKGQSGSQTVTVEVSDGKNRTAVTFKVDVKKADSGTVLGGMLMPILLVVIIAVVAVVAVALIMTRKKKGPTQAPVAQPAPPTAPTTQAPPMQPPVHEPPPVQPQD
jgi:hypothetical protein